MAQAVKKVAILGGGLGSLSTAFALTNESNWKERYEITIYQMGWRLGGKGASGRNLDPDYRYRIEEHGFHVWMGFYDNAFAMIIRAYEELARKTGPFQKWTDAFKKHSLVIIEEQHDGQRKHWQVQFPEGPRHPGTSFQLGLFGYVGRMFAIMFKRAPTSVPRNQEAAPVVRGARLVLRGAQFVWRVILIALLLVLAVAEYFLRLMEMKVQGRLDATSHKGARAVLGPFRRLLAGLSRGVRTLVELLSAMVAAWGATTDAVNLDEARRTRIFLDLSLAILHGILVDDIITKGFGSIDHLEFKDWLRKHNASPESAHSAVIDSIYDGNFSFVGGDRTKPNLAAGVALHCYMRIFLDYKGAFLYKMQAGMGDVVIAPLYLALKQRGVHFKFFHKVEELIYDARTNQIAGIRMTEQVALTGEYNPLVPVPLPEGSLECWPSTPRYESIRDGAELAASGINLESHWAKPWKDSHAKTLVVGTHYDLVVLGISIGGLAPICRQLIDHFPGVALDAREGRYRCDAGDATLAFAHHRRSWLDVSVTPGRELRGPGVELAGCVASDSERAAERALRQVGGVLLLRTGGRAGHPTGRSAHVCRGSAAGRAAHAPAVDRAACRLPVAGHGEHRRQARRGQLGSPARSAEPRGASSPCRAVLPRERAAVRPVRPLVDGRHRLSAAAERLEGWKSDARRRLDEERVQLRLRRGNGDLRASVFTCDLRISSQLLRRTPLRDVQPLSLPVPDEAALSPTRPHFVARTSRSASPNRRRVSY